MANWLYNSQIKEALGIDADYTAQDNLITQINNATTQILERLLGRSLTKAAYVQYVNSKFNGATFYDVYGNSTSGYGTMYKEVRYTLNAFPVDTSEDFSIEYRPTFLLQGQEDILQENEFSLDEANGYFIVTRPTSNNIKGFKVSYSAGYEAVNNGHGEFALSPNLPADLVQAALYQAMHIYDKNNPSNINVRESRSQGSTNATRFVNINALAPEALAIIVQNKRRFFKVV